MEGNVAVLTGKEKQGPAFSFSFCINLRTRKVEAITVRLECLHVQGSLGATDAFPEKSSRCAK